MPRSYINAQYSIREVQHTLSTACPEYSIHLVQQTPSTESTQDWLYCIHSHNHNISPKAASASGLSLYKIDCYKQNCQWEHKCQVNWSHSGRWELTNVQTVSKYSLCHPIHWLQINCLQELLQFTLNMASTCLSKLTSPYLPTFYNDSLHVRLECYQIMASMIARSSPPYESPNSHNHGS